MLFESACDTLDDDFRSSDLRGSLIDVPSGHFVGLGDIEERRLVKAIDLKGVHVTWREGVALSRDKHIRWGAWDGVKLLFGLKVWDRAKEGPGIWMARIVEYIFGSALLNDLASVHDGDIICHVSNDTKVMGDEDDGEVLLLFELVDELKDLRLDGYVKSGRWLVADKDFWA